MLATVFSVNFLSCDGEDDMPPPPPKEENSVNITFHPKFGSQDLEYNKMKWITAGSDTINVNTFKFILSNISLQRTDDSIILLGDGYAYIDLTNKVRPTVSFKNVPEGSYKAVSFKLGIDSIYNHGDPLQWPADHPLDPLLNGMHWGWAGGYIFLINEGYYTLNGSTNNIYSYHMVTEEFMRDFSLNVNFNFPSNKTIHINADLSEMFQSPHIISIKADGASSHSSPGDPLMTKIKDNITELFSINNVE